MASSLRLITSNLITRSFRPTLVSGSRFLSIDPCHRSHSTTTPTDDFFDQSRPRILWPTIHSMQFRMKMSDTETKLVLHGADESATSNDLFVRLNMPGLKRKKLRACAEPDKRTSDIKKEMKDGTLKDTLPDEDESKTYNIMANIIANDVISSFRDMRAKCSWSYYDMFFDRSILGKRFCPLIARLSTTNSFSIYMHEYYGSLHIDMTMPGPEKMKLTTQGLLVSLETDSYGQKRRHIKTFFDYNTFFIELKSERAHRIIGIHLPEAIQINHTMIKRKVKRGKVYAVIPCRVKKEELREIKDQLKKFSNNKYHASVCKRGF